MSRLSRVIWFVPVAGLLVAACGNDDSSSTNTAAATTQAPATTSAPVAATQIPSGASEIIPTGDLGQWAGKTVGIANLAPVPGAERFTKVVQACVEANGGTADFQDVGGDPTKMPAILENWINQNVAAVFNAGIDMTGLESLIKALNDADIPILTWGAGNPSGVINLTPEVLEEGRNWGRYLIEQLGGEGDVLLVTAQNPALLSREVGLKEVLAGTNIKLTVTGDPLGFSVEAAQKATETALQANPNYKAVIGAFGSLGVGAAIAVEAAGSSALVLGANGDPEEFDAIRAGGPFKMTLAGGHEFGGEAACQIAAGIIAGGAAPGAVGKEIYTTSVIVTADNVPAAGSPEGTPRRLYQLP
jgi:ribose transport system substrate-binding protein